MQLAAINTIAISTFSSERSNHHQHQQQIQPAIKQTMSRKIDRTNKNLTNYTFAPGWEPLGDADSDGGGDALDLTRDSHPALLDDHRPHLSSAKSIPSNSKGVMQSMVTRGSNLPVTKPKKKTKSASRPPPPPSKNTSNNIPKPNLNGLLSRLSFDKHDDLDGAEWGTGWTSNNNGRGRSNDRSLGEDHWGPKIPNAMPSSGGNHTGSRQVTPQISQSQSSLPKLKFKTEQSCINFQLPKSRGAPVFSVDIESDDQVIPITVCENDDPRVLPKLLTYLYPGILKSDVNWEATFTDFLLVNMKKTQA